MRTIAIINQKGGSGKTTTAINLSASLARRGHRVLLVDVDPQSHCALGLAIPESHVEVNVGDVMLAPESRRVAPESALWRVSKGLDLLPSSTRLAALEAARGGLAEREDRDRRLLESLRPFADEYDWCLIDCPPFIGLLTFNALRAADEVLIPVETGYFALEGATKQINTILSLGRRLGVKIPRRVVATMHDANCRHSCEILDELRRRFADSLVPCTIRFDPSVQQAASAGLSVVEHDPGCPGAEDYAALASYYESAPRLVAEPYVDPIVAAPASSLNLGDSSAEAAESSAGSGGRRVPPLLSSPETRSLRFPDLSGVAGVSSRAAELAERAKRLAAQSLEIREKLDQDPHVARVLSELNPERRQAEERPGGARVTARGVLFLFAGHADQHVCVAGDHNGWSATATPLRYNHAAGLHEAIVAMPPGKLRYRLVVDGRWMTDPANPVQELSALGGYNSVVEVPAPRTDAPLLRPVVIPA